MDLSRFPRQHYIAQPSPLQELKNLSKHLGGPSIWIKRDDTLSPWGDRSAGGNKTRKLEFLVADALNCGSDTLITCGATQSNHCRLTLAAGKKEGMKVHLVLEERVQYAPSKFNIGASGNNYLFQLLGADSITVVKLGTDLHAEMQAVAQRVRSEGSTPYIVPGGGSNAIGATGYVSCMLELNQQCIEKHVHFDSIVTCSGSGGTHSGIVVGNHALRSSTNVVGVSVRGPSAKQTAKIVGLCEKVAAHLGVDCPPHSAVEVTDKFVGDGYSVPGPGMNEAIELFARLEGIMIDPVYTGKTAAALIAMVRSGRWNKDQNICFVHTGGVPTLYQYQPLHSTAAVKVTDKRSSL